MEAKIVAIDGGSQGGRQGQKKRSSVSREKALEISERLKTLRNSRGLKLAAVARELNISAPAYYNYESGGTSISVTTLFAIAKFYRVAPEWLYSGEGAPGNSLCNAEIVNLCVETLGIVHDIEQQMKTPPDRTARARVFAALLRHRLAGDEIDLNTARTFYELADAQAVFQSSDGSTGRTSVQDRTENPEANH